MKRLLPLTFLVLAIFFTAGLAQAENLMGVWKEVDNWGARAGESGHKLGDGDHFLTMENAMFTLKVTEQSKDQRGFHGEWCSPNDCEDVVGAVRTDGRVLIVDEDGYFEGSLLGNTLELCYLEASKDSRIANCRLMRRQ